MAGCMRDGRTIKIATAVAFGADRAFRYQARQKRLDGRDIPLPVRTQSSGDFARREGRIVPQQLEQFQLGVADADVFAGHMTTSVVITLNGG